MIVVDTSVLVATFKGEPEADRLRRALLGARRRAMSAGSYLEAAIVLSGRRLGAKADLDDWITARRVEVVPVDRSQAEIAADAYTRFGKGRHPAKLNYGDCFAYALAKALGAPLLFKGGDFTLTDIEPALPAA